MPAACAAVTLRVPPTVRVCVPPELKVPVEEGELVKLFTVIVLLPLLMVADEGNVIAYV